MDKIKSSVAVKVTALVLSLLLVLSIVPVNGLTNSLRNSVSAAETPLANQATPDEVTVSEPDLPEPERKAITNIKGSLVISGSADCELISTRNDGNNVSRDIFSGLKDIKFICSETLSDDISVTLNTKVPKVLTNDDSKDIYYKIDGSVLKIIFKKIADGTYPLTIGNGSKASYYNFFVDSTAPTAEIKYDKTVSKTAIDVTVSPNDNAGHSGYSDVDYDKTSVKFVNSGETKLVPHNHKEGNKSFTFSAENSGQYYIELSDKVGNKAEIAIPDKFIIDKTAPKVTISSNNSDESYKNGTWAKDDVKVAFTVDDGEYSSGVDVKNIKVTSDVTENEYTVTEKAGVYYFTADTYGKYTIKATDNAGLTGSVTSETVKIDKTAASDIEVWFTKDNGILNFLTFGIYESSDVKASVKVYYGNDESKIKDLKLYNNESEISGNSGSKGSDKNGNFIQKSFTISSAEKNKAYNLSFYIEDEAGNKTDEYIPITNEKVKVYVDGSIKEINRNLFEVVFSESEPEIEIVDVKADNVAENVENNIYTGAITFKSKVKDDLSGLKDVKLYFNKASEIETDKDGNITNLSKLTLVEPANKIDISKTEKTKAIDDVSYTTSSNLATGEYSFVIAATNNNGKTSIKSISVLVDRTQPEITKFEYSAKDTNNLKLENGELYCDKPVTVKVYADDLNIGGKKVVSSGLSDIKLYNGDEEITATSEFDSENGCKTFELPYADAPYDLSAKAIDNLGNGGEENAPKTTAKSLKKLTLNGEILDIDDNFKVVVNNDKSTIENSGFEFSKFSYSDKNAVYSGDGTVSATITDKLSGISKVTVTVNDANVDGFCTVTDVENGKKIVFDTKKYNPNGIPDGEYTLKVTAENNCGIEKTFETTFYIDKTAPSLDSVAFSFEGGSQLDYGIYSNKEITMVVTVDNGTNGSPLKSVTVVDKDGKSVTSTVSSPKSNTVEFKIPEKKLNVGLQVVACDMAENNSATPIANDGVTVTVNSNDVKNVSDAYEVVYQLTTPELEKDEIKVDFADNSLYGKDIYKGQGTFSANVIENLSGLKEIKLYFDKKSKFAFGENNTITNLSEVTPVDKYVEISKVSKTNSKQVSYKTDGDLETGEYTFVIAATNNSGNTLVKSKTIGIDATNPIITKFEYSAKDTDNIKLVNGKLYCDKPVTVKVYADDLNIGGKTVVSSGLKDIRLYNGNEEITATSEFDLENGCKIFELPYADAPYDLSAIAIDNLGNGGEENAPKTTAKSLKKLTLNGEILDIDDNFKIVVNNDTTKIENIGFEFSKFSYSDENDVYSGDGTVSATITDKLSGISKVTVTVNDANVDGLCTVTDVENGKKIVFDTKKYNSDGIPSGKYTLKVTAENNCGINIPFDTTFYMDNSNPEIKSFRVESAETSIDEIISFLTFGIYSNKDINVIVSAVDEAPSSNFKDLVLVSKNGQECEFVNESVEGDFKNGFTVTKTFRINNGAEDATKSVYNLSATVTDKAEHFDTKSVNDLGEYINANGEKVSVNGTFEIVSTDIKPEGITHYSTESSNDSINKNIVNGKEWYSGDFKVNAEIKDTISGIKKVKVFFNGDDVSDKITLSEDKFTESKITQAELTLDTKSNCNLTEGENKIRIEVYGNSNNCSFVEKSVYVDREASQITDFEFKRSVADQIISFLTFGIYSNNDVDVKVTATDNAPSSGIDSIKLSSASGLKIEDKGESSVVYENKSPEACTYSKTFTLKVDNSDFSTEKSFYNDLTATVTDNVGNSVSSNYNSTNKKEIVITQKAPEISTNFDNLLDSDSAEWTSKYYDEEHNNYWFAGDVKFSFDVKDDYSKLSSVQLMLNGTDVTEYCTDKASATPGKYTEIDTVDATGKKISATTISIDTAKIPDGILKEGENIFTITATGNNGVTCDAEEVKFNIDTQKTENISFEFKKSVADQILSFLTFGIYSNNNVDVTVTAVDNKPSSGIDSIKLSKTSGLEIVDESRIEYTNTSPDECKYVKTFTLKVDEAEFSKSESFYNDLTATVTDKVGNVGSSNYNKNGKPEVVITEKAPEITKSFDNLLDSDSAEWTSKYYDKEHNNYWFAGNVKFSFDVKDDYSKLSSVQLMLNGTDVTKYCTDTASDTPGKYTEIDTVDVNGKEVSATTISIDTANIPDGILAEGENIFTITATGNNGVTCDAEEVKFNIDTQKTENIKFEFNRSVANQILSFLTFGIYSNNDVDVKVTATDNAPSSGIDSIKLSSASGLKIEDKGESSVVYENKSPEACTYSKTFTLKVDNSDFSTEKSFYNDLTATVTDNVGNSVSSNYNATNNQEIVITKKAPKISTSYDNLKDAGSAVTKYYDGKDYWFAGDVKFSFDVKDDYSKISSVQLMLNGTDVTKDCTDTASATPGKYTEIDTVDETGKKVSATTISIDTAQIPDGILAKGKNIFTITATGNNGEKSKTETVEFCIDTTKPQIDDFKFEPVGNMDEITTPVETTDYGYYFRNDINVTVIASDGEGSGIGGSNNQVSSGIYYRCVDIDGSETNGIVLPGESFTVKKDFKGQIYAYAIDNVGNKCSEQHPYGSIVESEQKHRESSNIDLETVGNVVNKDDANRNLYNNDVKITIALKDSYSGIRTVHYRIYDDYGDNIENTFSIDQSGNFSDNYGWSYTKDKNLVTELKATVPVAFNSNNIRGYVEFTDRAGHKEAEDIIPFSIDKTAPTIKVVYDNNDFKTYQGNKYFKADRTATITVTERNFNEADFTTDIKKAPNSNAGIDGWTHNYNSANPDASTHVAHISFTSDDDYTVDMAFKDMAQNKAESPAQEKFTLDKTLPKISVSFDNNSSLNGSYYKAERTATITIEEHNFAADTEHLDIKFNAYDEDNTTPVSAPSVVGWTSNGDTRTATVSFANDGKYEFTVDYKDLAYNQAEQAKVDTFFVDKKNPEIKFENVEANAAYADSISPVVVFTDNNYDGYTTLTLERIDINSKSKIVNMNKTSVLNGVTGETVTYDNFGTIEENDGIYKLSAKMVDKAGNEKSREIIFSVNRFGSTYMAGDENTESLISSGYSNKESDVFIKEINVNKVSKQSVSLACNNSSVSKLKADENYTVSSNGGSGSWFEYTYKINKDNFADEGYYTITLSSTDRVKHTVSNITALTKERKCPVSFTIDKTVPEVRISGIEDGKPYEEASRQVKVVCEDVNISDDTLVIELNGKELEAGEDKDFVLSKDNAGEIIAKFKVEAIGNDTRQNIKVSVADKAGNEGKSSVSDFILSASLLTRFFANTPLVIATFAAIAVIIGLVLFFVIRRRKKNEEK
ncbi:hypothetical protein [uncultured Ruminococcus sp.]|uniref:hypothetical protein n=1 Tax=uncultured Ruminococcus sp. TaxID=165186 RepID=UPI0025F82FFF|nr:hypothetical protein [uncultured Ruminococcus sp.]